MNRDVTRWYAATALALAAALPGAASAQSTWNLYNGSNAGSGCTAPAASFGNTWSCTGVGTAGTALTVSAYSTQNPAAGAANYQNTTPVAGSPAGTYYANAALGDNGTSGIGVFNRVEGIGIAPPNHAIDNLPGPGVWDGVLLNFTGSYVLSSFGLGWSNDGLAANASNGAVPVDVTVLRWTGAGAPTATSAGGGSLLNGTLGASGWSLVGSYQGVTSDSALPFGGAARNTGATGGSSYWLITAFNSTLNGGTSCKNAAGGAAVCDEGNDAFKLNYVTTTTVTPPGGKLPEPLSLALVATALVGIRFTRRKAA